jgi:hypothetical protein
MLRIAPGMTAPNLPCRAFPAANSLPVHDDSTTFS